MTGFEAFLLVWSSAFAGACLSEYVRRRWESRKPRYGRMSDDWNYQAPRRK